MSRTCRLLIASLSIWTAAVFGKSIKSALLLTIPKQFQAPLAFLKLLVRLFELPFAPVPTSARRLNFSRRQPVPDGASSSSDALRPARPDGRCVCTSCLIPVAHGKGAIVRHAQTISHSAIRLTLQESVFGKAQQCLHLFHERACFFSIKQPSL